MTDKLITLQQAAALFVGDEAHRLRIYHRLLQAAQQHRIPAEKHGGGRRGLWLVSEEAAREYGRTHGLQEVDNGY